VITLCAGLWVAEQQGVCNGSEEEGSTHDAPQQGWQEDFGKTRAGTLDVEAESSKKGCPESCAQGGTETQGGTEAQGERGTRGTEAEHACGAGFFDRLRARGASSAGAELRTVQSDARQGPRLTLRQRLPAR
jgi:hypothetical protein